MSDHCNSSLNDDPLNHPHSASQHSTPSGSENSLRSDASSDRPEQVKHHANKSHANKSHANKSNDMLASASALLSSTWPFSLKDLPQDAYLVGGSVRDALLGRQSPHLDLDFVLAHNAVDTAQAIAECYDAGFVLLDAERRIARVVFSDATADFAEQMGGSLEADLRRRDFTINAIAYSPHHNRFVDPVGGTQDLKQNRLCMISEQNLNDDPLRLLRAHRQAAQLKFDLDPNTQQSIRALAHLIRRVAPERVYAELSYLLNASRSGTKQLTSAWKDGLLKPWLPDVTADSLAEVARIDVATADLGRANPAFTSCVLSWLRDQQQAAGVGRSWLKVAKLSCLTADSSQAEAQLWQLKCSRAEVQSVLLLRQIRQHLIPDAKDATTDVSLPWQSLTQRQQYELFKQSGDAFPACALVAMALGACGDRVTEMMHRFIDAADPIAHPDPLLTGHDLMAQLSMKPSPRMGQLLESLSIAHAEGKISDRPSAIAFAQAWIAGSGSDRSPEKPA